MRKQRKKSGLISSKGIGRLPWIVGIVAVLALGVTAAVSLRASQAKSSAAPLSNSQPNSRANTGLRLSAHDIPIDPQTGQVRPLTQEEAQKLAAGIKELVNQSTDGLQSVRHADGTVELDLQGRFQNIAVARRNDDGPIAESCVDNPKAAAVFFEIDPQLVGVQPAATSPKTNSAVTTKGGDR